MPETVLEPERQMNGGFGCRSDAARPWSLPSSSIGSAPPPKDGRRSEADRHRPAPLRCRFCAAGGVPQGRRRLTLARSRLTPADLGTRARLAMLRRGRHGALRHPPKQSRAGRRRRRHRSRAQRRREAALCALAAERRGRSRGTVCLFQGRDGVHREIFRDDRRPAPPRLRGGHARLARAGRLGPAAAQSAQGPCRQFRRI